MDRSGLVRVKAEPFNAETPLAALREPLTPTSLHYVRSNFALPAHDGMLAIEGAVGRPLTFSINDLRHMPETTLPVTLECAGNGRMTMQPLPTGEPWSGTAVGTAEWTGVPLATVLERAKPGPEAREIAFYGADHGPYKGGPEVHFGRSLPVETAADASADILLAYAMNGEPLTADHGAPLRLLVPGWYGMASVKWLNRIEVRTERFNGPYQVRSYIYEWADREHQPVTHGRVRALITDPVPGATISPGRYTIRGKAWAGTTPIRSVEVCTDGGGEWLPADVEPALGPYGWCDWAFSWVVSGAGRRVIRARAVDAEGCTQPDAPEWNRLGYGNNAVLPVAIDVR
ncbi:MAG TPA: sulfite oxidase [Thermomicrobiales bacterium]|nr:sulfite oxidase [Thermomicrobiales bacterium]